MLQVIREYAADRLAEGPDATEMRRRHAAWLADLVEEVEPELERANLRRWQQGLRREEDNIRTALRWAIQQGDAETGLRIAGSLWRFWHFWGGLREGGGWLERVLAMPGADTLPATRARAVTGLAGLRYWQGQAERAEALYAEALELRRRLGDRVAIADALRDLVWSALARGQVELAARRSDEALEQYRAAGDEVGEASIMTWRHVSAFLMGAGGSYDDAVAATLQAAELYEDAGLARDESEARGSTAYVHWIAGQHEASHAALRSALRAIDRLGDVGRLAPRLKMAAALELALGRPERAVRLAAASARHADELGGELGGAFLQVGDPLEEAREHMTPEEHAHAVQRGREMSIEEMVAYALEEDAR